MFTYSRILNEKLLNKYFNEYQTKLKLGKLVPSLKIYNSVLYFYALRSIQSVGTSNHDYENSKKILDEMKENSLPFNFDTYTYITVLECFYYNCDFAKVEV